MEPGSLWSDISESRKVGSNKIFRRTAVTLGYPGGDMKNTGSKTGCENGLYIRSNLKRHLKNCPYLAAAVYSNVQKINGCNGMVNFLNLFTLS
jgi:hypothetical protein